MKDRILGLSGSLRSGSYNTALLRAVSDMLPQSAVLELYDYHDVPLYNEDLDGDAQPQPVIRLREAIRSAQAVIFATPEYNHGIPGVLKNAIDWASRPAFKSPLTHKPAGVLSASKSPVGGARAQSALRQVLAGTLTPIFPHVEMLIGLAHERLDASGRIKDPTTEQRLRRYVESFAAWIRSQRP